MPEPTLRPVARRLPTRTRLGWWMLCVSLAGALHACGGGGGASDPTGNSPSPAPAPSPAPSPSPSPAPSPSPSPAPSPTPSPPPAATLWVGPASSAPAGATVVSALQSVPWRSLQPGTLILVGPGNQVGPITITSQGTASNPIEVRGADSNNPPVLNGQSFDFQGAAHVKLTGFVVDGSPYGAVVIRRGSHHVTVQGNTLRRSYMGVNISDGAGEGLAVLDNTIEDNETHGIAVQLLNTGTAATSRLAGNTIRRNGHHGIELQTNFYVVERNIVSANGNGIGGATGIHLYASSASDGTGDDNIIRYNFSFNNVDKLLHWDGNGIQADQWCDRNVIAHNVVWGNDGAGVILFDSADNEVYGNTLLGNAQDTGRSSQSVGEIILSTAGGSLNRTRGNRVYNNVLAAQRSGALGVLVDATSAGNSNSIGPNLHAPHPQGTPVLRKGSLTASTGSELDRLLGSSGNLVEAPAWSDAQAPLTNGLKLTRAPSGQGVTPSVADILGQLPQPNFNYFGAYYTPTP